MFTVQSSNSPADMNYTTDNLVLYFYGSGYHAVLPTITEVRSKLGSGDVADLLLVYDGSEYAAYELNRRT